MSVVTGPYAKFLEDTSWYKHAGEANAPELAYLALGLAGEAGEFVDEVKKIVRVTGFTDFSSFHHEIHKPRQREKLRDELGDVLWYLIKLASYLDITIEDLMVENTFKLYSRMKRMPHLELAHGELEWPFANPSFDVAFLQKYGEKPEDEEEK